MAEDPWQDGQADASHDNEQFEVEGKRPSIEIDNEEYIEDERQGLNHADGVHDQDTTKLSVPQFHDGYESPDESEFTSEHVRVIPPSRPVSMLPDTVEKDESQLSNEPERVSGESDSDNVEFFETSQGDLVDDEDTSNDNVDETAHDTEDYETKDNELNDDKNYDNENDEQTGIEEKEDEEEEPVQREGEPAAKEKPVLTRIDTGDNEQEQHLDHDRDDPQTAPPDHDFYGDELVTPIVQQAVPMAFNKRTGLGIDTTVEAIKREEQPQLERKDSVSSVGSTETMEVPKRRASGTVSYDSIGNGKDRVVSRLVSNFESHIQEENKNSGKRPYVKRTESDKFSRSRARMIGQSLLNGVTSPPTSPRLEQQEEPEELKGAINRRKIQGGHLRQLSLSHKPNEEALEKQNKRKSNSQLRGLTLAQKSEALESNSSITGRLKNFTLTSYGRTSEPSSTTSSTFDQNHQQQDMRSMDEDDPSYKNPASPTSPTSAKFVPGSPTSIPSIVPINNSPPASEKQDEQDEDGEEDSGELEDEEAEEEAGHDTESSLADQLRADIELDSVTPPIGTLSPSIEQKRQLSVSLNPIVKETIEEEDEDENVIFGVCVVGFHHHRGPEVEYWIGPDGDKSQVWPNLPFQSLPDGSHTREENFCYFTLLYDKKTGQAPVIQRDEHGNALSSDMSNVTTLFGISCNRQVAVSDIRNMTSDITRSTVQKSVVVVARKPIFGPIKDKLAVVTRAYFMQGDFEDRSIVENLYDNLMQTFKHKLSEADLNVAMPLRELVFRLHEKVLVVLKAMLLEKKIMFYASNTELLCASQFSLVSLIPNLMAQLDDCGSALTSHYERKLKKPTSLKTSDRSSLLAFMGLPLQIFAEGGIFNPYVPLQQLQDLKAPETKYYMVGSTNSLLISPDQHLADVIVNMDDDSVSIVSADLKEALTLSPSDKKWMDNVTKAVVDSWDSEDPWRPKDLGFTGSEDYIRIQFEDYIINMLSSVKYDTFLTRRNGNNGGRMQIQGEPVKLYNEAWVEQWKLSNNYRIFNKFTDEELFDIVQPKHMAELAPNVLDIQRQIIEPRPEDQPIQAAPTQGIAKSVSRVFGSFWGDKSGERATQPKTQSPSPVASPARSANHSSNASVSSVPLSTSRRPSSHRALPSTDQLSLAESVASSETATSDAAAPGSSPSAPQKEGYFAGWSRWAATRRKKQLKSPSQSSINISNPSTPDLKEEHEPEPDTEHKAPSVKSVDLND